MAITLGTKTVLDAAAANIVVGTINNSVAATTSPIHGVFSGTGTIVDFAEGHGTAATALRVELPTDGTGVVVVPAATLPTIATATATAHTAVTTAYASGQIWSANTSGSTAFQTISVAKANNQAFTIIGGILQKSGVITTNALFRIHLFNAAPTSSLVDRGTWQAGVTLANWIGSLDANINQAGTDLSFGILYPTIGSVICGTPVSGAQTLYYAVEVRGGYTPVSSESVTPILYIQ